jgi:mRNA interferase MazF
VRPALVVALITGNLQRANQPTHCLIDPATPEGASSNLHGKSLVSCINLYTLEKAAIKTTIGSLSSALLARVDQCLAEALDLKTVASKSP